MAFMWELHIGETNWQQFCRIFGLLVFRVHPKTKCSKALEHPTPALVSSVHKMRNESVYISAYKRGTKTFAQVPVVVGTGLASAGGHPD